MKEREATKVRQRQTQILQLLTRQEQVSVSELSSLLSISEVTVRSDLEQLGQAGLLRRIRGGAARPLCTEQPLEETSKQHAAAKRRIGRAAAGLVQNGETIFLDVGSTTTEVARHLPPTLSGVTVVTNGLNIALELQRLPNLQVIVTGGTLRRLQHSLVSPYGLEVLSKIRADRLFLGCNGVHLQHGVTSVNHEEAEIKAQMVRCSREVVVVADASKLGFVSRAHIAPLTSVHTLIINQSSGQSLNGYAAQIQQVLCV
ncbi:DeoR/GlpR transcriptional regulator (plasmid) [Deinococcus psychrotolerans]|uniref:DeoR/GlpR transcriptional regulator n=1 Tax=Deinococcus psychrotolerans TaxID=2489213 RepID=A0A3G8YHR3_9DEIO|nr:DeoR/GlpR family DNA-binding transcription regulator [Deinococcus psychrotolerans]AZI44533.1 DeoR/GlpR transcriptional regulator [Deinococcus psychrotolerans]